VTLNTFIRPQVEYLLKDGWDITWISSDGNGYKNEIPDGIKFINVPFKRGIDLFGIPKLIFLLYRIFKQSRFYFVQYSTPNAVFSSSIAAWLARIPIRLYAQWGIRYVGFKGIMRIIFIIIEKWSCYYSTIIEPDSHSNLKFSISEKLYPKSKGRVIWNGSASGVNLEKFNIKKKLNWRDEFRKKIDVKPHYLLIGFIGSIREDKGCNELFRACRALFNRIHNASLLIVGDKRFYNTIELELRTWAETSLQVIVIPPSREIPQYLSCMDVFTLPSYREGFGSVVVEAQAMGVPVVVSNVPGPVDAMKNGITGLTIPAKDSEALASAIELLLLDSVKRTKYGEAAQKYVTENYEGKEYFKHVLEDKNRLLSNI